MILGPDQVMGHIVSLKTTRPQHIDEAGFQVMEKPDTEKSFETRNS